MNNPDFSVNLLPFIEDKSFVKLSLGNYRGGEKELKNIYAKLVLIKRELKLTFTYRYKTRDITKNYGITDGLDLLDQLLGDKGFAAATVFLRHENRIYQLQKTGKWSLRVDNTNVQEANLQHDHSKTRKISALDKVYLQELRLTDARGEVYKNAQDKWKQINHYIELLGTSLEELKERKQLNVVDMGAGKGYLTFALYDYLTNELATKTQVEGIEYREDLVELCNAIAQKSAMSRLRFRQGTIADYEPAGKLDILIALHACDTATDDAIYKGIVHQAELIIVAPCCHKQIRRELEKNKEKNDLDFMTQYGIFQERHAEMLTDSIRALLLEYCGYQTKVMQFISDQHTPKNVMIVASKKAITVSRQKDILAKLQSLKQYFGIGYHHLERLLGLC